MLRSRYVDALLHSPSENASALTPQPSKPPPADRKSEAGTATRLYCNNRVVEPFRILFLALELITLCVIGAAVAKAPSYARELL